MPCRNGLTWQSSFRVGYIKQGSAFSQRLKCTVFQLYVRNLNKAIYRLQNLFGWPLYPHSMPWTARGVDRELPDLRDI
jgi:hypothetical protein